MSKRQVDPTTHLRRADAVLARAVEAVGQLPPLEAGQLGEHYGALVRAIVGQQLSTRAAQTIYGRLTAHFGGAAPSPVQILEAQTEVLRGLGLSAAKTSYLRSLAEHVTTGAVDLAHLETLPDAEIVQQLTDVRGVGEWTAQMFLIFQLARPDVLAPGDLGIRKAAQRLYGLPALPDRATLEHLAAPWQPYRSWACRYLWRSLDAAPA
jgi:DNA-3-methyladenine glycosylase II